MDTTTNNNNRIERLRNLLATHGVNVSRAGFDNLDGETISIKTPLSASLLFTVGNDVTDAELVEGLTAVKDHIAGLTDDQLKRPVTTNRADCYEHNITRVKTSDDRRRQVKGVFSQDGFYDSHGHNLDTTMLITKANITFIEACLDLMLGNEDADLNGYKRVLVDGLQSFA